MDTHAIHDTGGVFKNTEVIDLCNSIINIHRALKSLGQFLNDLEDPIYSTSEALRNDFMLWGIRAISEKFITDQNLKLTRIMEIYQAETERLIRRTTTD